MIQSFDNSRPVLELNWSDQTGLVPRVLAHSKIWNKNLGEQTLSFKLVSPSNPKLNNLRIDPIAEIGGVSISKVEIFDNTGKSIWLANSQEALVKKVKMVGILPLSKHLICMDDDPHILIDVGDLNLAAQEIEVTITLSNEATDGLAQAIHILSQEPTKQEATLLAQKTRNNEARARIEYLNQQIDSLHLHRDVLSKKLDESKALTKTLERDKRRQFQLFTDRLQTQYNLNKSLYEFLTNRPSTRIKGIARRILNKVRRRPQVELPSSNDFLLQTPTAEHFEVPKLVRNYPLPQGDLIGQNNEDYGLWVDITRLTEQEIAAIRIEIEQLPNKPLFSILVPIYNTDPEYLLPMIESVKAQLYPYWELCLVDDCSPKSYLGQILQHEALQDERIKVQLNKANQGISLTTNDALAMANGDYIALLDHDDEISIDALYENAKVINQQPEVGLIYSDEDKLDIRGHRLEPFFKPDYSPDFLSTNNYICHFSVIKKSLIDELGGFREGLDGSQDHDVILRAAHNTEHVVHIPKILYHWRKIPGSTAVVYDAKSYAWEAGRKLSLIHI